MRSRPLRVRIDLQALPSGEQAGQLLRCAPEAQLAFRIDRLRAHRVTAHHDVAGARQPAGRRRNGAACSCRRRSARAGRTTVRCGPAGSLRAALRACRNGRARRECPARSTVMSSLLRANAMRRAAPRAESTSRASRASTTASVANDNTIRIEWRTRAIAIGNDDAAREQHDRQPQRTDVQRARPGRAEDRSSARPRRQFRRPDAATRGASRPTRTARTELASSAASATPRCAVCNTALNETAQIAAEHPDRDDAQAVKRRRARLHARTARQSAPALAGSPAGPRRGPARAASPTARRSKVRCRSRGLTAPT